MLRKDTQASKAVSWAGTTVTVVEAGLTQLSNVHDVGDNVYGVVITFLLTFNAAATNGATIRLYEIDPEGNVSSYANYTASIAYASGAKVWHSKLIELGHQRFKVEITNDDSGQDITAMSATLVRVVFG